MTWLVNGKTIARKIKNRNHGTTTKNSVADGQEGNFGCETIIECPYCGNVLEEGNTTTPAWPGLPAGVKFDPTDREILEHLEAKLGVNKAKPPHPYIDVFIPTLDGEDGIYYTHPERLPDIKLDGNCIHYFHRPMRAFTTGTRKRRKIEGPGNGSEMRWHKTGRTRPVMGNGGQLGFKKIMVLYTGTPGKHAQGLGKTNWVMHQYHMGMNEEENEGEYVVAKIFYQTQLRQSNANRKVGPLDGNVHPMCEHTIQELDEVPDGPTFASLPRSDIDHDIKPDTIANASPVEEPKGLFQTLSEDAQRMWFESFHCSLNFPEQDGPMLGLTEQGECSRTRRLESQQGPSYNDAIINGPMALHGLVDVPMNSPKLSDTDLFNILANEEIQAALKGKRVDEVMPTTTIEGNVIEIGSKEDMANKFEALENIILETPPDFIIGSLLNSQEALEALEMFKYWSDSQKGDDNFNFIDLFK